MPHCLTLKKSNCKNCYKCIRHCPVKAIRFSGNQAHIIGEECILCGECFVVCPQNAKEIADGIEKGVKVTRGQKLGEVGNTAISELADEPHVHIEMTVNGLAVDPRDYFTVEAKESLQNGGK